jgi:hypothetical protein
MRLKVRHVRLGVRDSLRIFAAWRALAAFGAALVTACSTTKPQTPPDFAPKDAATTADRSGDETLDASTGDEAGFDASILDGNPATDGEAGCACSYIDSGIPQVPLNGVLPLACYCVTPWAGFGTNWPGCMSYDEAVTCHGAPGRAGAITTYTNCNLLTVTYGSGLAFDERHYDATTHELVGARRWVDHAVRCGTELVFEIRAGLFPSTDCEKVESSCIDAGPSGPEAGAWNALDEIRAAP